MIKNYDNYLIKDFYFREKFSGKFYKQIIYS